MTISEMIHEIPHMRYRLESAKHKETLDEIEEVLRHYKEINEVLDKIRAEIEQYEADCLFADDSKECKKCDKVVFGAIYRIIDKYKAESEDDGR